MIQFYCLVLMGVFFPLNSCTTLKAVKKHTEMMIAIIRHFLPAHRFSLSLFPDNYFHPQIFVSCFFRTMKIYQEKREQQKDDDER